MGTTPLAMDRSGLGPSSLIVNDAEEFCKQVGAIPASRQGNCSTGAIDGRCRGRASGFLRFSEGLAGEQKES